jgi:transcription termination/antitermination protein NusA
MFTRNKLVRLKLDTDTLHLSSLIEKLIKVNVKDCFKTHDTVFIIVGMGWIGKAIGKGAVNVKKVQEKVGKKVRFIEYNDNVTTFVKNIVYPLRIEQVFSDDGVLVLKDSSRKIKGQLIGPGGKNLETITRAVNRFFDVQVRVE